MNGIDGVAIATGQDWRAIEASCHAYASQNSSYKPFTSFSISKIDGEYNLLGSITIPVTCGTVGGAISSNPIYKYNLALLNNPTSKQLAMIFACVGLAQNFGALRALVTEGIQKGHMTLHANNIALAAGIDQKYVNDCVDFMVSSNRISQSCAKEYAIAHELHLEIIKPSETEKPSMFYFEEDSEFPVSINIAFKTLGENVVIQFTKNGNVYGLFGDKTHEWFTSIVKHLDSITLKTSKPTKLSRILKLLSVLANVLIRRMMIFHPQETREFVLQVLEKGCDLNISSIGIEFLDIGRPLFFSIYQVFQYRVSQWVSSLELKQGLLSQLDQVLNSLVSTTSTNLADLLKLNKTRFPITLFLLCDAITLEISSREINQVVLIAKYLECIQNIIHDIAYDKAVRDFPHASDDCGLDYGKAVNLYVLFLKMQGFSEYVINDDLMSKFLGVFSGVEDIVDGKEALVGSLLIDSDMFLEIVDRLKVYYRVQGGFGILMPALE